LCDAKVQKYLKGKVYKKMITVDWCWCME